MEREITFVKVQPKKKGAGYQLTIPKNDVAEELGLTGGEKMRVFLDKNKRRIIYEVVPRE